MTIDTEKLPPFPDEFDGVCVLVVGGWVRDFFREGVEPSDVDLMVAGVSREELLDRGFREIDSPNNDTFGVFQDSLGREVAMAREETSTGDGHTDFDVSPIDPSVSTKKAVRRDLKRRDITVNSMAIHRGGELLDPYGGRHDLEDGIIRAVDKRTFQHDPLRILRGARFAARLDAEIAEKTRNLMWVNRDRLSSLPKERIWMELEKTLKQADEPSRFFYVLDDVGALEQTFSELAALKGVPAGPAEFHSEGDAFTHTMLVLEEMNKIRPNDELALLMSISHDLGKSKTDTEVLPSHREHGTAGAQLVENMAERLGLSNEQTSMMKDACRFHTRMHDIEDLNESTVLDTLQDADDPARLVSLAMADSRGRRPRQEFDAALAFRRFADGSQAMEEWTGQRLIEEGYSPQEMGGEEFGNLLRQKRVERMREQHRRESTTDRLK